MALNVKRLLPWILGALLVLAILAALRPQPVPADFAVAERGPLAVTLAEEGETRVVDRYVVSAQLAGRVLRIELEPGDPVVAGETVLATFQPSRANLLDARGRAEAEARAQAAQAAVGRARADLERARAELAFWEAENRRLGRLAQEGIIAQGDLEAAELELEVRRDGLEAARFAVQTAEYELEGARAVLRYAGHPGAGEQVLEITSPVDGEVLRRLRESETVVQAGEPLLEVGDPSQLEIVADFLSRDAVSIEAGQEVIIEDWGGDHPLAGRVRRVEPAGFMKISALGVEEQRVNVIVDLTSPRQEWQSLGDGYRVEVQVVLWSSEEVLKLPLSALFRDGGEWATFIVEEGEARLRRLQIGHRSNLEAEVLSGLETGERVVVHPSDAVEDGVEVAARE